VTRLRLHHRIVIPFVLVAVVATSAAALFALSVVSRTFEADSERQATAAAEMMSRSDFALNPSVVQSARQLTGSDVLTFTAGGAIVAGTLDRTRQANLIAAITHSDGVQAALGSSGESVVRRMTCDGPCVVAYRRLANRPDTVVAIIGDASAAAAAVRGITRTILLAAALSLVAMGLASQIVARRLTAPIDALVAFARDVVPGSSPKRAPVPPGSDDEVSRLARAFNDMLDRLDQAQQALVRSEKLGLAGLLAARVAHDVRNPLSAIKMQTQLLRAKVAHTPADVAMVDAVLHDIALVESVVRDLIELARPGDLTMAPADLNGVVDDALQQMAPQFGHRGIRVDTRLDGHLPDVALDAGRFRQALLNVLVNAADAMPTGGTITVVTRLDAEASTVELDVCDDGVGVNSAVLDRVFDPFVSTKRDGVGLGLVNAKAVVESHGGRITLEPREPRGTRVRITMPVARLTGSAA
jgi:signal transduction histidine kinase